MSTSFTINIIDDEIIECDETFNLTLNVPVSSCGAVNGATDTTEMTMTDNDGRIGDSSSVVLIIYWSTGAELSFDQSQYSIDENITPLSVGLMLSRASKDIIVEATITDGSAKGRWCNNCWCKVDIILLYSWYRLW